MLRVLILDRSNPVFFQWVRGLAWWVDVLLVLVLVSALAVSAYVLTFWGFRLTRNRLGSLHTRRGLLTTRETSIDPARSP